MITEGDKVKILDFGLAKALSMKRRVSIYRNRHAHGGNDEARIILGQPLT